MLFLLIVWNILYNLNTPSTISYILIIYSGNIDKQQPKLPPIWTAIPLKEIQFWDDSKRFFLKIAAVLNKDKKE